MKTPILVTGAARSGTSMIAGIINICGAFGGMLSGPNANNAKGMFENARIRNDITKPYLRSIKMDHMGQYPLPDITTMPIPNDLKERVENIMIEEGYVDGPWFYKGAKMCLTWPMWVHAFPDAKWIIVRRKSADIVNSCIKTGFMRAFVNKGNQHRVGANNETEGWLWWVRQHELRFIEMINEGVNIKVIWPDRMVNGDYSQVIEMIDWLGLKWNNEVYNFISPKLWNAKKR